MRPLLALVLSVVIVGTVFVYLVFVNNLPPHQVKQVVDEPASGHFRLELTLTRDAEPDAFEATSLVVSLPQQGDRELFRREEAISCAEPIVIDFLTGFLVGENELFIQVGVGDVDFASAGAREVVLQPAAVRVQLFRDRLLLAEETLWASPGEPIQGKVLIDVPSLKAEDKNKNHDH